MGHFPAAVEVIGVTPGMFVEMGVIHQGLTDLKVVDTMHERKAMMAELSDGFVAPSGRPLAHLKSCLKRSPGHSLACTRNPVAY